MQIILIHSFPHAFIYSLIQQTFVERLSQVCFRLQLQLQLQLLVNVCFAHGCSYVFYVTLSSAFSPTLKAPWVNTCIFPSLHNAPQLPTGRSTWNKAHGSDFLTGGKGRLYNPVFRLKPHPECFPQFSSSSPRLQRIFSFLPYLRVCVELPGPRLHPKDERIYAFKWTNPEVIFWTVS